MNRISSERESKPSNLSRNRLDGFDALSDDIRFIYLHRTAAPCLYGALMPTTAPKRHATSRNVTQRSRHTGLYGARVATTWCGDRLPNATPGEYTTLYDPSAELADAFVLRHLTLTLPNPNPNPNPNPTLTLTLIHLVDNRWWAWSCRTSKRRRARRCGAAGW